ncbi:hypothetical protein B0I71DRAFT_169095 [Yarrowia lipolytica]|uniref:F-box domain-containing protein n=1 Tax=Yarrowia lipolytica TaxID=4952 RepID=A0A371BZ50_YARLL|nr:hypothetical protein B0I71DRAFT_169095 [Yarrowia lipolytica]
MKTFQVKVDGRFLSPCLVSLNHFASESSTSSVTTERAPLVEGNIKGPFLNSPRTPTTSTTPLLPFQPSDIANAHSTSEHMHHIFPAELTEPIYQQLDLSSLCALSQSCRFYRDDIPETLYEEKLQEACPWFEPQFSHRSSWRECAVEYTRRMRHGAKFAPTLVKGSHSDYQEPPTLAVDEHQFFQEKYYYQTWRRNLETTRYRSKFGIEIDLAPIFEQVGTSGVSKFLFDSRPHVLIAVCLRPDQDPELDLALVIVKYKDSDPILWKFHNAPRCSTYVLGPHVFLNFTTIADDDENDYQFQSEEYMQRNIFYLDRKTREFVSLEHLHIILKSESACRVICFDGLFHEMYLGNYRVTQATLEKDKRPVVCETNSSVLNPRALLGRHHSFYHLVERDNHNVLNYKYAAMQFKKKRSPFLVDLSTGNCVKGTFVDCETGEESRLMHLQTVSASGPVFYRFLPRLPGYRRKGASDHQSPSQGLGSQRRDLVGPNPLCRFNERHAETLYRALMTFDDPYLEGQMIATSKAILELGQELDIWLASRNPPYIPRTTSRPLWHRAMTPFHS